ncbi:MAG: restriction endonuclease [Chitinophagales bacterium]
MGYFWDAILKSTGYIYELGTIFMELRELEEFELEDLIIDKNPMANLFAEEKKWFLSTDEKLLGILLEDKIDKDWTYIVLSQDEDEAYRAIDVKVSIDKEYNAEKELITTLQNISKVGKKDESLFEIVETDIIEPSKIIITNIDEEIKNYFKRNPDKLYELSPRKFEELIASILEDLGFEVELTKATRDGGRDILAYIKNQVTSFLTYVECKRYKPENKIDVSLVRQILGVHAIHKPAKSIIVTTSYFTKDAQKEAKHFENQLELKDFEDIKSWLQKY